jgi:hypothetical protein
MGVVYSLYASDDYIFAGTSGTGVWRRLLSEITIDDIKPPSHNLPTGYSLSQNYPNPFNPTTEIQYQLPENCHVILKVYDLLGREIKTLVNETQSASHRSAIWNAPDVASGIYFYKLDAVSIHDPGKSFAQVKKMLLLR